MSRMRIDCEEYHYLRAKLLCVFIIPSVPLNKAILKLSCLSLVNLFHGPWVVIITSILIW